MQNTILDSTISTLLQDNSLFNFNAVHNGEACIESLRPEDRGTEHQFWFTRALLCTLLGVKSEDTITNHVDKLLKRGVIDNTKNLVLLKSEHGRETTLYDLKVFNYLVMRLDTDQAWEKKAKFNDVLVERETNQQAQTQIPRKDQLYLTLIHAESEADRVSALTELNEINKQEVKAVEAERDEAVRTKAMIGSRREATAMATASAKSKECNRLTAENEVLKDAIGRGTNWRTISMMTAEWKREFGHAPSWQKLKKFSKDLPKEMQPIKDIEEKVVLSNGSEKVNISYRYHMDAWERYRKYEEDLSV